jgi:hypothetical protein
VEISLADDVDMDMEASGVATPEVLYNHKDSKGAQLFESIEKTNNGGTYRVLFDEAKTVEVDAVLDSLDGSLASLGDWKIAILTTDTIQMKKYELSEAYRGHQQLAIRPPFGPATWQSSKYKAFLWKLTCVPCSTHSTQKGHPG